MRLLGLAFLTLLSGCTLGSRTPPLPAPAPGFRQPDPTGYPELYVWTDTTNVYVIREGASALLVNLGDGSVLDHLGDLGVKQVDWVLFTDHHREQVQGFPKLKGWNAKLGAPAAERELFEQPAKFRKMNVRLNDAFTIHGTSYVRPSIHPIPIDRAFARMDTLDWKGREIWCIDTRGNSPGGMSYLMKRSGRWLAFTGDLMVDGARMNHWFDSEWDYGFAAGIYALCNSAGQLEGYDPAWLLPSHGPAIQGGALQLAWYQSKLRALEKLFVRGYDAHTFSGSRQDPLSHPTAVPNFWQISPHLYKFRGPNFYPNFCLVLADSGHGLAIDCGLFDEKFLDQSIELMKVRLGLKQIDVMIPTHMHGDHFLQGPQLRNRWGAKLWAIDRMGPPCEHPEWFDYSAPIQAYGQVFEGKPIESVTFDRLLKDGESFQWEGFTFTVDWMPGQTEFALAVRGMIDGQKVVFTGDNIFGDPADPRHSGHECVNAHNSAVFEEGYIYGAEYLCRIQPDLIMGGHSYVMPDPNLFIGRYRRWAYEMRDMFQTILPDYPYDFDPFWVRAEPYRVKVRAGESVELSVIVRNFRSRVQTHHLEVHAPAGLSAEPGQLDGNLPAETRKPSKITLRAAADAVPGVRIVALDVTLDGRRYGELFDAIVEVTPKGN
jgi:glyoxylase-like metal-dependent hydrolase (beta-lactamase superfamily II)